MEKKWTRNRIMGITIGLLIIAAIVAPIWVFFPKNEVRQVDNPVPGSHLVVMEKEVELEEFAKVAEEGDTIFVIQNENLDEISYMVELNEDGVFYIYKKGLSVGIFNEIGNPAKLDEGTLTVPIHRDSLGIGLILCFLPTVAVVVVIITLIIPNVRKRKEPGGDNFERVAFS